MTNEGIRRGRAGERLESEGTTTNGHRQQVEVMPPGESDEQQGENVRIGGRKRIS